MLILSRRPNETIRFPQLGIAVSIVSVRGSRVQVGIDAPPEIQVIRRELENDSVSSNARGAAPSADSAKVANKSDKSNHQLRNQLNKATLGVHLAQRQLAAGQIEAAEKSLAKALEQLAELDSKATPAGPQVELQQRNTLDPMGRSSSSSEQRQHIDVLLVEDDPNEQALLRGLLELEGFRVHTASNGYEALGCLTRVTPRFVLLDMLMPGCDGRETCERIREIPAFENLPIFAVSGSSPDSVGLRIGRDGVDDWFPKPLNAPQLVRHIRDRAANLCT